MFRVVLKRSIDNKKEHRYKKSIDNERSIDTKRRIDNKRSLKLKRASTKKAPVKPAYQPRDKRSSHDDTSLDLWYLSAC